MSQSRLKNLGRHDRAAFDGHTHYKIAFLWNAFLFANQPCGVKLNRDIALIGACFELGPHLNRRDQQHAALVTIVGHAAHRNFLGGGPN